MKEEEKENLLLMLLITSILWVRVLPLTYSDQNILIIICYAFSFGVLFSRGKYRRLVGKKEKQENE